MNGTGDLVGVGTGDGDISTVRSTVLPVEIVMAPDQSLYPTFWRRMVWVPEGISFSISGVYPLKTLSTYTSAPEGSEVIYSDPVVTTGETGVIVTENVLVSPEFNLNEEE